MIINSRDNGILSKISIIIVTYNAAAHLQKCLNSIFRQKYPSLEIIVLDGQSKDGTVNILEQNTDRIDFWKSEKDDGIYDAMNKALEHISGEWVYFLGSDDELLAEFSDMAYELKNPSSIYYGSVYRQGSKYLGEVSAYTHAKTTICHQAIIYPAAVFKKYKFDTQFSISADHVLNMWCWKDRDFRFQFVDHIIAIFNHEGISSTKKDLIFEKHKATLIRGNYSIGIWLRFLFKEFKASFRKND